MKKRKTGKSRRHKSIHSIGVRRSRSGDGYVLTHPRCVRERAEDLQEVQDMIAAEEFDIAVDELRFLLADCHDFIEAHQLLGHLAIHHDQDTALARGHFGVGYQLADKALRAARFPCPLLFREPANAPFFRCGDGLITCLLQQGEIDKAKAVRDLLLKCDPDDPLQLAKRFDA